MNAIAETPIIEDVPAPAANTRFAAVDVILDGHGSQLAAYQVELKIKETEATGSVKFVGVEGGEHQAFTKPPYYDPKALTQSKLVLAAFDLGEELPDQPTRVARIHMMIIGDIQQPQFETKLIVAADGDGNEIDATATIKTGDNQ
ncbi:MAG: hypothetical protein ACYTHJ_11010 [Planctomycetota bacterium]|jgi:hypothetical protein